MKIHEKGMVSEVGRTVWLLMFCLDGRPSFQKFSLSPSYLAEVVLSLSPTTCSTWQEWHSQQCPRRPKVCMYFGSEKMIGIAIARSKKLSDCIWATIAGMLFSFSASDEFQQRLSSPRAWALRALGLLIANGALTGGVGEGFLARWPGCFLRKQLAFQQILGVFWKKRNFGPKPFFGKA